ncbi:hypothetical protein RRG08_043669 [Elysia crispata]|uniref:Uncharacterized protein n=1 Tax=Elysia crispata TaxID=231223 RepID=A0AAE0ZUX0_9GAST|nr:hypothetical protein RRG08_043669 [Elysia crispata]
MLPSVRHAILNTFIFPSENPGEILPLQALSDLRAKHFTNFNRNSTILSGGPARQESRRQAREGRTSNDRHHQGEEPEELCYRDG